MRDKYLEEAMVCALKELGLEPDTPWRMEPFNANLWISSVYRIIVEKEGNIYISLFTKRLPEDRQRREFFLPHLFSKNEEMAYTKILTAFTNFQKEQGLKDPVQFSPRCLYAMCDGENDIIIVEDLVPNGYSVLSRNILMNIEELRLLMTCLGQFHALSLAMKATHPDIFKEISMAVKETLWIDHHVYRPNGNIYDQVGNEIHELLVKTKNQYAQKLQPFLRQTAVNLQKTSRFDPENEPWNVITHGDMWPSNLLVNSLPNQQMRFIDFQQCRYGSPALDVSCVLYLCMDRPMRDGHREELLQLYHRSMSELLVQLGLDPEVLFPFCQVEEQLKRYGRYGLGVGFINIPHAMQDGSNEDLKVEENQNALDVLANERHNMSPLCQQRIIDNIKDAVDRGYLDYLGEK